MKNQWQRYKELELMADSIPEPYVSHSMIVLGLSRIARRLSSTIANRSDYWRQIERLDHCLAKAQKLEVGKACQPGFWYRLWVALNQPLFEWHAADRREPEIRQIPDQAGHLWWYAYDPRTGQTAYLESEEEVQIWLEERFRQSLF